jgi:hypothetical protein
MGLAGVSVSFLVQAALAARAAIAMITEIFFIMLIL